MQYCKNLLAVTMLCALPLAITPLSAAQANPIEPSFNVDKDFGSTVWYAPADQAAKQADLDFVKGMRPHHAGALTMSADYLKDKGASNTSLKGLVHAIVNNQSFEIKMLDTIETLRNIPNDKSQSFFGMYPAAIADLGQKLQFTRTPVPGIISADHVSTRDVQFAKAMIIHHQGALDMAKDYLKNPNAKNGYLRHMCLDILLDQQQEIDFMTKVISKYAGNPEDVKIDASMIHGMEGMSHEGHSGHHGHHAGHHDMAKKAKAPKKPVAKHTKQHLKAIDTTITHIIN